MKQYNNLMVAENHFKYKAKVFISSVLLSLFAINAFGQPTMLSREQMIEDIEVLFSTIEAVHPDMFAVYPQEKLARDIEKVKSELKPSGDIFYFFNIVAPLVVRLGDGHTFVNPPHELELYTHLFPFSVGITYPDKVVSVRNDLTQT